MKQKDRRRGLLVVVVGAAGLFALSPGAVQADLNQGLVARWCFDDCMALDCSGHGLNGTNFGAACVPSPFGDAFEFTGRDLVRLE